ncbi:MAG: metal-sensitive transcriptional regulator [Dehalococcoidia bacterium]|nr:metal-sensitive transcriptional regulator [Dehalococcoidia bacterium]
MVEETISKEVLLNRLKRLEGQVRGVERMIEEGRDCESIITQLGAVRSAIESVGALLLRNYMKICFDNKTSECSNVESLERAVAIWSRVHIGDKT